MYKFVFDFARDKSFKNLNSEVAKDLWELLLSDKCKFFDTWIKFLSESQKLQVITKDTWNTFYDLINACQGDFNNFVDDGTWPSIIDAFSTYFKS